MHNEIMLTIRNLLLDSKMSLEKDFLDTTETARFLGISKQTLYKMNHRGVLPRYKPEGTKKIYYLKSDLLDYLSKNRLMSEQEQEEKAKNFLKPKKWK